MLVGLASKNAILIVEFAKHKHEEGGLTRREATLEACKLRLRPILMTSFAFILGVVPLLLTTGAGAEMRHTLGTAVFSGMLGVTLFGIFLTPVFFYVIEGFVDSRALSSPRFKAMERVLVYVLRGMTLGLFWLFLNCCEWRRIEPLGRGVARASRAVGKWPRQNRSFGRRRGQRFHHCAPCQWRFAQRNACRH